MVKLLVPGYKRLRTFVEEFKKDFDCLQPSSYRQHQYSIYLAALKDSDNHDQLEGLGSSLTLITTASISNSAIISPQPMSELLSPPFYCVWICP